MTPVAYDDPTRKPVGLTSPMDRTRVTVTPSIQSGQIDQTSAPAPPAAQTNSGFTAQHPQVAQLMRDRPDFSEADAIAWAQRYYQPSQPAAPAAPAAPGGPAAPAPPAVEQPTTLKGVLDTPGTVGATPEQGAPTTVANAFQQALINRLAPQDISANNPAIRGSIAANRNAEARGLSKTREALAERAAATGQTGAQESGIRQAIGESAGRQGAYEGNALYGLHQQQANDLSQGLGLVGSLLPEQQRQELQRYGLDLNASLSREGLAQQGQLGNRELDIRNALGLGNLDLGRLGLNLNNQQFDKRLGADIGLGQANLNQNALLALLAGL
jgi:hypothetical protein